MTVFGDYARYYDLLYRDKDYAAEAASCAAWSPRTQPVAVGFGTGVRRRAARKAPGRLGLWVHGVDRSEEMVKVARKRRALLAATVAENLAFSHGDMRFVDSGGGLRRGHRPFSRRQLSDTSQDFMATFPAATGHLRPGGVFLFDCWYGPAVLAEPPETRVKRLENEAIRVTRIAEPKLYPNDNCVDVNYHVFITDKSSGAVEEVRETHRMRYLFRPEVDLFAHIAGLEIIETGEWITSAEPGFATWGVYFVHARA